MPRVFRVKKAEETEIYNSQFTKCLEYLEYLEYLKSLEYLELKRQKAEVLPLELV